MLRYVFEGCHVAKRIGPANGAKMLRAILILAATILSADVACAWEPPHILIRFAVATEVATSQQHSVTLPVQQICENRPVCGFSPLEVANLLGDFHLTVSYMCQAWDGRIVWDSTFEKGRGEPVRISCF
jgi:hypothetical protein